MPVALVVSSVSSYAARQARHSQNAWARNAKRVESCRVETSRAKWNLGYRAQQSLSSHRAVALHELITSEQECITRFGEI